MSLHGETSSRSKISPGMERIGSTCFPVPSTSAIAPLPSRVWLQRHRQQLQSASLYKLQQQPHTSVCQRNRQCQVEAAADGVGAAVTSPSSSVATDTQQTGTPQSQVWELDFSSRPVLDERGKKRWELLICDPQRSFTFSAFFPNNKINSTQLKNALGDILDQPGAAKPRVCRFFRGQMQTIISRALADLDIKPLPSRRCFTLMGWLQERLEQVYKRDAGYSEKAQTLFTLDLQAPAELPDNLRGEQWNFVQLPLATLQEELGQVARNAIFGDAFDLQTVDAGDLALETPIPGVAVYSKRALPLAAWTNGFELAALVADTDRACLILETGVNQRWRYGSYRRSSETTGEAREWEAAKKAVKGLHFLAIQKDEEAERCAGLWLLQDREPVSI